MSVAEREGVRLAWESAGSGPPLLLIQGLAYDRVGWGHGRHLLSERFRVVSFDNRGVGESDVPPGPYTTAEMAADAAAVLDASGFERAHVLGASLGGMIAQEFALAFPQRIDHLVLACTTPGGQSAYPLPQVSVEKFALFPTLPIEEALRMMVENSLSDESVRKRQDLVEEIYAYRLAHRPTLEGWQFQAGAAFDFDAFDRLGEITAPTLLLHGTADDVVDVRNGDLLLERIRNARLERFEGAGHLFFWEEPERFARSVGAFLLEPA